MRFAIERSGVVVVVIPGEIFLHDAGTAGALNLADVASLSVRRFDLLQSVNVRGTFVVIQACVPHLRCSDHAHVLTLSPPLNLDPIWFRPAAYTVSKYGMTIVTLGVAGNCLWPLTAIATAAVQNLLGGEETVGQSRTPQIVADAAGIVLRRNPTAYTGNATIVEDVLAEEGITDLTPYSIQPGQTSLARDLFVDAARLAPYTPETAHQSLFHDCTFARVLGGCVTAGMRDIG